MRMQKGRASKRASRYSVSRQVTERTIEKFFSGLDCPRALTAHLLYKYGEHQQLADLSWSPNAYRDAWCARNAYLATEFLSKSKFLKLDVDPEAVAMDAFRDTEAHCRQVNRRFNNLALDPKFTGPNVWLLNAAKRKVAMLLCEDNTSTSFDPEEWIDSCGWGPGTTVRVSGSSTNPAYKFQHDVGMTKDCYTLVSPLFSAAFPRWGEHLRTLYPTWGRGLLDAWLESGRNDVLKRAKHGYFDAGNIILAVPKKAKTHRIISKEPGLNCFFQLGVGAMIRRRLQRNNFDLRDQSRNQRLSFQASLGNQLATVDKKDASGCIATAVVRELLPDRWFSVMDSLRSRCGTYRRRGSSSSETFYFEKFSSMGNGFTFPLQSLLFAAAALAVCEYVRAPTHNVGVYGDDVIIPTAAYDTYVEFCEFLGFRINRQKSFSDGPFRESCGSHYYDGADLKPLYLKERLSDFSAIFRLANGVKRLASRNSLFGVDSRFLPVWLYLRDRVPKKYRFAIPEGYGDGGFVIDFDECTPCTNLASQERNVDGQYQGIEGFRGLALVEKPVMYSTYGRGLLIARLHDVLRNHYGVSDDDEIRILSGSGNNVARRRATRTQVAMCHYPEWYNLGPWTKFTGSLFLRASSA